MLVVAYGDALRVLIALLDRLTEQGVEDLNIPIGAPLCHGLDRELRPGVRGGGCLDPKSARSAAATVAAEGQARTD
ncbi:hypothetical protein [Streptomyces canus]|uniref:hypothetical protein n=1 Tax=Streptomyces canus TaxID=58343 RepID=UPI0036E53C30